MKQFLEEFGSKRKKHDLLKEKDGEKGKKKV